MGYASRISGTGSFLPPGELSNLDLEKLTDTNNEWILERTGIASRHIADPNTATSDLALAAAEQALRAAGLTAQDLDAILVGTATPDHSLPSTACILQAKLGCRSIMALDISAACSGFIYGLSIADQFIRTGMYRNILVIGAETLSKIVNYKDRQTCILFGDGAGAVVVSRTSAEPGASAVLSTHLHASGENRDMLSVPAGGSRIPITQEALQEGLQYIHMRGREVFKLAVRTIADRCTEALAANGMSVQDIDWFVIHQANQRIIEAVADVLKIAQEKLVMNIKTIGNTSAASVPIAFDQWVKSSQIQRGQHVLMAAFGAGMTSGSALVRY